MILDICQASLYSLLFGADGPPLASDEDFSAKLKILSKTIFDGCDKNQDGGAFEKWQITLWEKSHQTLNWRGSEGEYDD